ncbi:glutaredoxin 3 [Candidatus Woesearchaeota archaeon]|nr:glutaredoxin 3 [Candidatus Woesearchaeota archaeon]|tara:strand:+ start:740 stop:994 length:255 start_codon:yes stop_codon:yes gene_type:complete
MPKIEIYTKSFCPFCARAKQLLKQKGAEYKEYNIENNPEKAKEMEERSGRRTVPEIFIDNKHIGGSDDLYKLEAEGKLDPLLKQ